LTHGDPVGHQQDDDHDCPIATRFAALHSDHLHLASAFHDPATFGLSIAHRSFYSAFGAVRNRPTYSGEIPD
jgi:hypothetical protein